MYTCSPAIMLINGHFTSSTKYKICRLVILTPFRRDGRRMTPRDPAPWKLLRVDGARYRPVSGKKKNIQLHVELFNEELSKSVLANEIMRFNALWYQRKEWGERCLSDNKHRNKNYVHVHSYGLTNLFWM